MTKAISRISITMDGEEVTGKISDGYHTFDELYDHRITLWIALCRLCVRFDNYPRENGMVKQSVKVWRTTVHSDGSSIDGWFVLGMSEGNTNIGGQITYHLPLARWGETDFAETLDRAPEFDGHTSQDVLERLKNL